MTPRELQVVLNGVEKRELARLRQAQALAYNQAALTARALSSKPMPKFERVFPDPSKRNQVMTGAEMLAVMRQWTQAINGPSKRE